MESVSQLYRLLARVWHEEVDQAFLADLTSEPLHSALTGAGVDLPSESAQETLDDWATDFCQLFIGPSEPLRPIQSVWTEGQLEGQAATSMRETFLPLLPDFEVPSGLMADHLAIQLAVMAEFIDSGVEDLPRRFFDHHLRWTETLTLAAASRAKTSFYRTIIKLTAEFLRGEGG